MAKEVVLRINGQLFKNSFNELVGVTKKLERELRRLPVGTDEWLKKAEQVKEARSHFEKVKNEINEVRFATKKSDNWFKRLGNTIGESVLNVATGFTLANIFEGFIEKGSRSVDKLLEIADVMSGVKKTTGLTTEEVKELWDEFDNIDTRTTKVELMKIAEMAGRLGIQSKAEVAEFTKEIDKAYVALGDSFSGGLEAVASKLGKIKGLFEETSELNYATAINKVGSALNELAANGTSSEENISDFALRVGQLPNALKPSIDVTLGLGAAFEESGVDAQIAASGYSKFITTAAENIEPFADSMHMTVNQAKELINTKPEEFFLRFAKGMKGLSGTESAKIFDALKLNTLEVQKAIGVAADNTDRFTKAMNLSSNAMEEMTSMNNEFNEVNNNAAAIWQKIKNAVDDLSTSGEVFNWFEGVIKLIGDFAGATESAKEKGITLKDNLKTLVKWVKVLTAATMAYIIGQKLYVLWTNRQNTALILKTKLEKAEAFVLGVVKGATLLVAAAKALLNRNTIRAAAAMRLFNASLMSNPLGLLVGVLSAVISYFIVFNDKVEDAADGIKELSEREKDLEDIRKRSAESSAKEISTLDQLYKTATNVSKSIKERKEAINQLREMYPAYFSQLNDEIVLNGKAEESYNKLRNAILNNAKAKALEGKAEEYMKRVIEIEQKRDEFLKSIAALSGISVDELENNSRYNHVLEKLAGEGESLSEIDKELDNLKKDYQYYIDQGAALQDNIITNITPTDGKDDDPKPNRTPKTNLSKQIEKESKVALKEHEKWSNDLIKAKNEEWDARHALNKEGLEKEIAQILETNERKRKEVLKSIADAEKAQNKYADKISELEGLKATTKDENKAKEIEASIQAYESAMTKIDNVVATHKERLVSIEKAGDLEILKVKENYLTKAIELERKHFDDQLKDDKILFETELETLNLSEKEKEKKREEFRKQQLVKQSEFLKQLTVRLKDGINSGDWTGLLPEDLIISDEQKQQLIDRLRELGLELSDVKGKLNSIKSGGEQKEPGAIGLSFEQTDLFGMSPSQWEQFMINLENGKLGIEELAATVMVLQNAWNTLYDLQAKKEKESLKRYEANAQRKKDALKNQLDNGYINQKEHDAKVKQIEDDVKKRQAEFAYQQAKRDKQNAIISAIIGTSTAVVGALGNKPWGPHNFILAGIVGALGAAQTAIIASQPLPSRDGYAQGGPTTSLGFKDSTGHEVAGVVHADEYVIPKWLRKQPEVARVEQWLEAKRTGRDKPFYSGGSTSVSTSQNVSKSEDLRNNEYNQLLLGALLRNIEVLEDLEENGVKAYIVADEKAGKMIIEAQKKYNLIKNKNRI